MVKYISHYYIPAYFYHSLQFPSIRDSFFAQNRHSPLGDFLTGNGSNKLPLQIKPMNSLDPVLISYQRSGSIKVKPFFFYPRQLNERYRYTVWWKFIVIGMKFYWLKMNEEIEFQTRDKSALINLEVFSISFNFPILFLRFICLGEFSYSFDRLIIEFSLHPPKNRIR